MAHQKKEWIDQGHTQWLRKLPVPLFFGRVSKVEEQSGTKVPGRLRIYSSYRLYDYLFDRPDAWGFSVRFDSADQYKTGDHFDKALAEASEQYDKEIRESGKLYDAVELRRRYEAAAAQEAARRPIIWLGEPVVAIDFVEIQNEVVRNKTIEVLASWMSVLDDNRKYLPLGTKIIAEGGTMELAKRARMELGNRPSNAIAAAQLHREMAVPLTSFLVERLTRGTDEDIDTVYAAIKILTRMGVNVLMNDDQLEHDREMFRSLREQISQQPLYRPTAG